MNGFRRWLHSHGHHQFCRVVTKKVMVGHKTDFSPVFLVGKDPVTGEETRVDATVFGGSRKPVYEWRVFHQ